MLGFFKGKRNFSELVSALALTSFKLTFDVNNKIEFDVNKILLASLVISP
jgi:hypothetical protein